PAVANAPRGGAADGHGRPGPVADTAGAGLGPAATTPGAPGTTLREAGTAWRKAGVRGEASPVQSRVIDHGVRAGRGHHSGGCLPRFPAADSVTPAVPIPQVRPGGRRPGWSGATRTPDRPAAMSSGPTRTGG